MKPAALAKSNAPKYHNDRAEESDSDDEEDANAEGGFRQPKKLALFGTAPPAATNSTIGNGKNGGKVKNKRKRKRAEPASSAAAGMTCSL